MVSPFGKLILAVLDPMMLFIAQVHQATAASPSVGVEHALGAHSSPDYGLQSGLGATGRDLGVDSAAPPQDAEDRSFAVGAAPPFSLHPPRSETGLADLDLALERRLLLTQLGNALAYQKTAHLLVFHAHTTN
ncbi:hypothetical protein AAU61_01400 [Desulfocarbo indianensis]|nr:hypothetical protein AAU61_01400 [Desulfocarbo indianensis]